MDSIAKREKGAEGERAKEREKKLKNVLTMDTLQSNCLLKSLNSAANSFGY